jgi:hypothetical protein
MTRSYPARIERDDAILLRLHLPDKIFIAADGLRSCCAARDPACA